MPPILTDAERDKFVLWLDAETAEVERLKFNCEELRDEEAVARLRKESAALRIVALRLCTETIVENVTEG